MQAFREIPVSSRNYWLAQRQVPACYAELAKKETGDKAKALWQQMLDSSKELVAAAEKAGDEQNPKATRQSGHFYMCWAFDELGLWKEALAGIDDYLAHYAHGIDGLALARRERQSPAHFYSLSGAGH